MRAVELEKVTKTFANSHRSGNDRSAPAVDQVDLVLEAATSTALIGPNGAGKSTLLRLVAGILAPTSGTIRRRARCAAMIELGGGFHPDLTAAENVDLGLALAGYGRTERGRRGMAAIEFAGLGAAVDRQTKYLSSGMTARLAAAVAVHSEPDVLLVDEVLAVGDAAFQRLMLSTVADLVTTGTALVLVTHSLDLAAVATTRTVWFDAGRIIEDGETGSVLAAYEAASRADRRHVDHDRLTVEGVLLGPSRIEPGDPLTVTATIRCHVEVDHAEVALEIRPAIGDDNVWMRSPDEPYEIRQVNLLAASPPVPISELPAGRHTLELTLPQLPISSSRLELTVVVRDRHHRILDEVASDLDVGAALVRPHFHLEATRLTGEA